MYLCPHCNAKTISIKQKFFSHSLKPAMCSDCGKESYSEQRSSTWSVLIGVFGFPVILVISLLIQSWVLFAFAITTAISFGVYSFHRQQMVMANVDVAIKKHWLGFYILLIVLFWLIYDGFAK